MTSPVLQHWALSFLHPKHYCFGTRSIDRSMRRIKERLGYGKSVVEMKARAGEAGIGEIISLYEAVFDEKFEPTYVSEEA